MAATAKRPTGKKKAAKKASAKAATAQRPSGKKPAATAHRSAGNKPAAKPAAKAAAPKAKGEGTRAKPWQLTTPSGGSAFEAFRDEALDPPALVVRVGKTELRYQLRCLEDLRAMLKKHGDWMLLGGADEQKPAADGTVESWGRSSKNPVGGWYGLKKGLRGRFGVYVPPVLGVLGWAEVEQNPKNNRMRAI